MHKIRDDIIQKALVVGDHDEGIFRASQLIDAIGDDFERVYIQAGISLVEDGQFRFKHGHLEDLVPLLLPA